MPKTQALSESDRGSSLGITVSTVCKATEKFQSALGKLPFWCPTTSDCSSLKDRIQKKSLNRAPPETPKRQLKEPPSILSSAVRRRIIHHPSQRLILLALRENRGGELLPLISLSAVYAVKYLYLELSQWASYKDNIPWS